MQKGDKIRISLHGHDQVVDGTVVEPLRDGFVKAVIDDQAHPLCYVDDKPRVLTVSPEMYEPRGKRKRP